MSKMEYMPVDCLQVPKVLFQMEKYKNLSNTAKILYSLFLDRLKFAVQNGWVDHNGDLFVVYPKSEMKKNLNMTRYGVDQAVQELVQVGKLVRIIPNNGKANHFYINDIYENEMEEESMMTLDRIMMNRKEFYEYVKDNVKEYLPESYRDAEIKLQEVEKNNGLKLTGITIPNGDQRIVPTVYLDSLYQEYINGKDVDSCVGDVADMRIEAQGKAEFFDMGVPDILDYEKMKDKLQMRICDKEWNTDRLADKVVTEHGDFAAYYAVNLEENGEGISSIPVTVSLMNEWGVSVEQIQADAMMADKNRGVQLVDMTQIIESMIFGGTPKNLLNEKLDMETVENPMFCLTNESKMNGASLLLQEDIRKQIGECLGSDYFVIPSSVHEVLILPDNGILQVPELNAMVQEVNETQVERQEQLSDKVQFCDKKTAVLENAERREARLEKEKVAEKAEVKGGIHGRLEKAKAEIKAKGTDTIPKSKARDLATAL